MLEKGMLALTKSISMLIMFMLILIVGNIPLRSKAFKQNKKLLALSSAFSGGLFLAVGLVHLLPECNQDFQDYFQDADEGKEDPEPHFPFAFLITTLSFAFILFIQKILVNPEQHIHVHGDHDDTHNKKSIIHENKENDNNNNNNEVNLMHTLDHTLIQQLDQNGLERTKSQEEIQADQDDEDIHLISHRKRMESILSTSKAHHSDSKLNKQKEELNLTPFILQIAIGIHAVFQGLAIGIQDEIMPCIAISAAVVCHKWAQGLTLGLAFRQAEIDLKTSSWMILIQAAMNPMGIGLGWYLSDQGPLITGIFTSISAGTFVYIATLEVIVEEFNKQRYKLIKFVIFLSAIAFVSGLWFIETLTGA